MKNHRNTRLRAAFRAAVLTLALVLAAQTATPFPARAAAGNPQGYPTSFAAQPPLVRPLDETPLRQGNDNGDSYTKKNEDLFTTDMVHNNPGEEVYDSAYTDDNFLASRGYSGHVFFLYDAAQFGLLWDGFDEVNGKTGSNKVFPEGSAERTWAQAKRDELIVKYNKAVEAGQKVYFMMDMIVVPVRLKSMYPEIVKSGTNNIDIMSSKMKQVMDCLFEEMFTTFPQIDGIYVRYGETYVGSQYRTPYHTGNNPIQGSDYIYHDFFINYLRQTLCVDRDRDLIYRTWGFGDFQKNPEVYLRVTDAIEPHERLYFCIKHTGADFWRNIVFNQCINIGKHQQIVEVQAAREYEGKGAFPNYVGDGVINGFEEYDWMMTEDQAQCLRDVVNTPDSKIAGIWTWSRGGGWGGPYINGPGGPANGSEMWCDLNAYVVTQWAKDTSKTDKYYALKYAREILGMSEEDAQSFYRLCIMSSRAVLLGRSSDNPAYLMNTTWTRDADVNASSLKSSLNNPVRAGNLDIILAERAESVRLWEEMLIIAEGFTSGSEALRHHILTTTQYGYYLFALFEQLHIATGYQILGESSGVYDIKIKEAAERYDELWAGWQTLKAENDDCPSLYNKSGFDNVINPLRFLLSASALVNVGVGSAAQIQVSVSPIGKDQLTYESSAPAVAKVDAQGRVTGVSVGVARVTIRTKDNSMATATLVIVSEDGGGSLVTEYEEDFESGYPLGETLSWPKRGANYNPTAQIRVVEDPLGQDNRTLQVDQSSSGSGSQWFYKMLSQPITGKVVFEADFRLNGPSGFFFIVDEHALTQSDKTKSILAQIEFIGGKIRMSEDNASVPEIPGASYAYNEWQHIRVEIDTKLRTCRVSVGGGEITRPFRNATGGVGGYAVGMSGSASNNVWLDNVKITREVSSSTILFEDFDSGYPVDEELAWPTRNNGTAAKLTVTRDPHNAENLSLQVYQPTRPSASQWFYRMFAPQQGLVTFEADMKLQDNGAFLFLVDENKKIVTQVDFRQDGNSITIDKGGVLEVIQNAPYLKNQWYHVKIVCNTDTKTFTATIGDNQPVTLPFREADGNVAGYAVGMFYSAINTVWYDNISVTVENNADLSAALIAETIGPDSIPDPEPGDARIALPVIPPGFTVSVKSCVPAGLVAQDGAIHWPDRETQAELTLAVTNNADPADTADTVPIPLTLTAGLAPKATADIRADAVSDVNQSVEYTVSLENMKGVMNVRIYFETDGSMLESAGMEVLSGAFTAMNTESGTVRWVEREDGIWQGEVLLMFLGGEAGFTSAESVDVIKLLFNAKRLGSAAVKLTGLVVTGLDENFEGITLPSEIRTATATTDIVRHYSRYDLNKDGIVDERDLAMAQRHYLAKIDDPNWEVAKVCDFNGDDVVDMLDLIDLFLHFGTH